MKEKLLGWIKGLGARKRYAAVGKKSGRKVRGVSIWELYDRLKRYHSEPEEDWELYEENGC